LLFVGWGCFGKFLLQIGYSFRLKTFFKKGLAVDVHPEVYTHPSVTTDNNTTQHRKTMRNINGIILPTAPKGANTLTLTIPGTRKRATVGIQNADTLRGTVGVLTFSRFRGGKVELLGGSMNWNGQEVAAW
jgi:hypothetical protein